MKTLLLLTAGLLLAGTSLAQGKIQQSFETSDTGSGSEFRYTATGGTSYTAAQFSSIATNTNASPKTSPVYADGTTSYGAVNNTGSGATTATLTFERTAFRATTGNYLLFRLASYATNSNGGMDNATSSNGVTVNVAYNGSSTFTPTLKVLGVNRGSVFGYDASGTATRATVDNTTPTLTTVTSPNDPTTGYSTVRVDFGPSITSVQVQIVLEANGKTALFVDQVSLNSSAPLPVELTNFSGVRDGSAAVLLKWSTAQEKNNDRFELERSPNGYTFSRIGTVAGAGTSTSARQYRFTDTDPLRETSYYRLKQIDTDGSTAYSPIIVVRGGKRQLLLSPNPAISRLGVQFSGDAVAWRITNAVGQVLRQGTVAANGSIDVGDLHGGVYFFEVTADGQRSVQRFQKAD